MSIVRENLMTRPGYAPYCGRDACFSRAPFDGAQFKCVRCGWRSQFPEAFVEQYKAKWAGQNASSVASKEEPES